MLTLDRHRQNGYSIESFVVYQRGSPVGIKKKIKKELIGTSDYPSNKIFTISNFITFTRLILTLVFLYLFVTDNNRVVAIVIYAIAASTDWMDGQIARMTKTVSWLGKVMDPICDRALLFTGVLGLVVRGELPIWVCVLIIGRDIYLGIGTLIVRHYHRRPIDVVFPGKIATALLMTGFSLMLLGFCCPPRSQHSRASTAARCLSASSLYTAASSSPCSPLSSIPLREGWPLNRPSRIPRTRTSTFLTPKSKTKSLGYDYVRFILCGVAALDRGCHGQQG